MYANFVKKGEVKQNELGDDFKGSRTTFTDGPSRGVDIEENHRKKDDMDERQEESSSKVVSSSYKAAKQSWKDAKRAASEAEDIFAAAVIARDEAFEVYVALKNERKLKKRKLTEGDDDE